MTGRVTRAVTFAGRRWELAPDEASLTFDAVRRRVTRHAAGRSDVVGDDIWTVLQEHLAEGVTAVGYLGYACRSDLPAQAGGDVPDAVLLLATRPPRLVMPTVRYGSLSASQGAGPAPRWYAHAFAEVQEALRGGHTYETNLTYRLTVESPVSPEEAFARLSATDPTPYAGLLEHDLDHEVDGGRAWLVSASPERYARIEDGWIETRPIKGTTPRDQDPEVDVAHARRLAADPKLRSENLIVTDLLRNDVSIVCEPGTVSVPRLMEVEAYAAVHQLVTTVRGRLRNGVTPLDAVRALFPAGSMTGAPKQRTMELISRVEGMPGFGGPRGAYAGAFGRISRDGADLGVVIRSATTDGSGRWTLGTGGGVTVGSDVEEEWAETRWKAARVLSALSEEGVAG